ncbi:MAG: hypothetical protein IKX42_02780, partial [Fibrobacter sp.]|nr:hypothetical protein [Fibrobacter sp.]
AKTKKAAEATEEKAPKAKAEPKEEKEVKAEAPAKKDRTASSFRLRPSRKPAVNGLPKRA